MTTGNVGRQTVRSHTNVWSTMEAYHLSAAHPFTAVMSVMSEHVGSQEWISEAAWMKTSL